MRETAKIAAGEKRRSGGWGAEIAAVDFYEITAEETAEIAVGAGGGGIGAV